MYNIYIFMNKQYKEVVEINIIICPFPIISSFFFFGQLGMGERGLHITQALTTYKLYIGDRSSHLNMLMFQGLCATRAKGDISRDPELTSYYYEGPQAQENESAENTALEMSGMDQPGLLSEISAVLVDLGCIVTSATAWTHNDRVACIIYVEDASTLGPIKDPIRLARVEEQLESVVEAHSGKGERKSVRLRNIAAGRTHTERRLHQLMSADRDYENCRACHGDSSGEHKKWCDGTHVSISRCEDRGYWVVNVTSRDRPKLLFDTVCVLTDMQYVVFHAAIRSKKSMADQVQLLRIISNYPSARLPIFNWSRYSRIDHPLVAGILYKAPRG